MLRLFANGSSFATTRKFTDGEFRTAAAHELHWRNHCVAAHDSKQICFGGLINSSLARRGFVRGDIYIYIFIYLYVH